MLHQFSESEFYDYEKFANALADIPCANIDFHYYHTLVKSWAKAKGIRRVDWSITARLFILTDLDINRARLKK